MPQAPDAQRLLDEIGLEDICDRLTEGESYRVICTSLGIGVASLCRWLAADAERSTRAKSARIASAQAADDMAEAVLLDKTMDVARARELASHYRWRAKTVNPAEYGEKLQVDNTHKVVNLSDAEIEERSRQIRARLAALADEADRKLIADGGGSV